MDMRQLLVLACVLCAAPGVSAQEWRPERNVEIIVPTGAGSALDRTGRKIQKIIQDRGLVATPGVVVNKPGGGLAVGFAYLNQHRENGHFICITNDNLLTNHLTGKDTLTYTDVTPLAQLYSEYVAFAVRADSPIRSGIDLVQRMRADPGALAISVATALGGANHLATVIVARAAGVVPSRLKMVVFNSSAEGMTHLLGGHLDVVAAPPPVIRPHLAAGKVRMIALAAPRRLSGELAQVPTWRELGVDAVYASNRGVAGPRGLSQAQIDYWDRVFSRLTRSDEWREDLDKNLWIDNYLDSARTREALQTQYEVLKTVLRDLGLLRTTSAASASN